MERHNPEKILYSGGHITISEAESSQEHNLSVGQIHCYLQRGILEDLANRQNIDSFRASLYNVDSTFLSQLEKSTVPENSIEHLAWAFAKARIKEVENERDYFMEQARD